MEDTIDREGTENAIDWICEDEYISQIRYLKEQRKAITKQLDDVISENNFKKALALASTYNNMTNAIECVYREDGLRYADHTLGMLQVLYILEFISKKEYVSLSETLENHKRELKELVETEE